MPIFTGFSTLSALLPFDQAIIYPLTNTTTDPTSQTWRTNNPNYRWIPNVGIAVPQPLTDVSYLFDGNTVFNDPDVNLWNASTFVNLTYMFSVCRSFNQPLNHWLTTSATNMSGMFRFSGFNQNINSWDVSQVTNMSEMFYFSSFNQPLNNWVTSSVTNMFAMFKSNSFNQNINSWDVSQVTNMSEMFFQNFVFNQALNNWNTGSVTNFSSIFKSCRAFNQDIGSWNVSKAQNMSYMFYDCTSFNCGQSATVAHELMQRLNKAGWQTRNVTDMTAMFAYASVFNGDISGWCVPGITSVPPSFALGTSLSWTVDRQPPWSYCPILYEMYNTSVDPTSSYWRGNNPNYRFIPSFGILMKVPMTNASDMFYNRTYNDPSTSLWDTSAITNMEAMFAFSNFNQPIGDWDVSRVTNMAGMFAWTPFDQPIGSWNVGNVTDMNDMFYLATNFNQNIGNWDVRRVIDFSAMFFTASRFNCGLASGVQHTLMQRTNSSGWSTNAGFDLGYMFDQARSFAGNMNQWCTTASYYGTNIPPGFTRGAQVPVSFRPQWGTCPVV